MNKNFFASMLIVLFAGNISLFCSNAVEVSGQPRFICYSHSKFFTVPILENHKQTYSIPYNEGDIIDLPEKIGNNRKIAFDEEGYIFLPKNQKGEFLVSDSYLDTVLSKNKEYQKSKLFGYKDLIRENDRLLLEKYAGVKKDDHEDLEKKKSTVTLPSGSTKGKINTEENKPKKNNPKKRKKNKNLSSMFKEVDKVISNTPLPQVPRIEDVSSLTGNSKNQKVNINKMYPLLTSPSNYSSFFEEDSNDRGNFPYTLSDSDRDNSDENPNQNNDDSGFCGDTDEYPEFDPPAHNNATNNATNKKNSNSNSDNSDSDDNVGYKVELNDLFYIQNCYRTSFDGVAGSTTAMQVCLKSRAQAKDEDYQFSSDTDARDLLALIDNGSPLGAALYEKIKKFIHRKIITIKNSHDLFLQLHKTVIVENLYDSFFKDELFGEKEKNLETIISGLQEHKHMFEAEDFAEPRTFSNVSDFFESFILDGSNPESDIIVDTKKIMNSKSELLENSLARHCSKIVANSYVDFLDQLIVKLTALQAKSKDKKGSTGKNGDSNKVSGVGVKKKGPELKEKPKIKPENADNNNDILQFISKKVNENKKPLFVVSALSIILEPVFIKFYLVD